MSVCVSVCYHSSGRYAYSTGPTKGLLPTFLFLSGVTIGFERTEYSTPENSTVEVCAVIIQGSLEREVTVSVSTAPNTATGKCYITQPHARYSIII